MTEKVKYPLIYGKRRRGSAKGLKKITAYNLRRKLYKKMKDEAEKKQA